jgi:hypothetical protein
MNDRFNPTEVGDFSPKISADVGRPRWVGKAIALAVIVAVAATAYHLHVSSTASVAAPPATSVAVSVPLQQNI